ncbi:hypothetical protein L226DRAFT_538038 [Lentinus tigrinus ALCF2SS1-7]|uniref:Uncharacterized protein n=1 Tax=Lentinus tigrinus ALCF2SS1-6 TaxID=1328759 RepID=A0A5C2RZI1_9APHY|nr:hypothetical protein L227DRAFT_656233 [Lentinus tigrinus ALCF2SS1-6]RPD71473.1 hypothetical protein L226DRAFT_538038 [Lentinus tigrinus ALCF2SS1-7]
MLGGFWYTPMEGSFAVIRMDPAAMVRHLNDPEALRAAEALSPQSYLVYLDVHRRLPIRGEQPWHAFDIYPVWQSLRPSDEDKCITPDMCMPIFPNKNHPSGRAPLMTKPAFPFDNCYIWSEVKMEIRVCPREEGFNWKETTALSPGSEGERRRIGYEWDDRDQRILAEQVRQPNHDPESPSVLQSPNLGLPDSVDDFTCMTRLFADPVRSPELHPFCHLWTDLASNIKQDEITNPKHLFEERDAIVRIIREARARDPTLPFLPVPRSSLSLRTASDSESWDESELDCSHPDAPGSAVSLETRHSEWWEDSQPETKRRRFRPFKLIRKVGLRVRSLFRIPYIPVWP